MYNDMPALPSAPPAAPLLPIEQQLLVEMLGPPAPMRVRFYLHARRNDELSSEDCPVFDDVPYIELVKAPTKDEPVPESVSRPADQADRARFPTEWQQFISTDSRELHLRYLPGITPARFAELTERGIRTVQMLAVHPGKLPDNLASLQRLARRILSAIKPRYAVVDGQMREVA